MKKTFLAALVCIGLICVCLTGNAWALDQVFIISGDLVKVMIETPAASGEQYEAVGDPETLFASKGEEAYLTVEGKECSKYVLVRAFAGEEPGGLFLTVDGRNYIMKEAVSASGSKYQAVDDPETVLWNKEASVILTVNGTDYPGYDIWQPLGRIWLPPANPSN